MFRRVPDLVHVRRLALREMPFAKVPRDVRMATTWARASHCRLGSGKGPWKCAVANVGREEPEPFGRAA